MWSNNNINSLPINKKKYIFTIEDIFKQNTKNYSFLPIMYKGRTKKMCKISNVHLVNNNNTDKNNDVKETQWF